MDRTSGLTGHTPCLSKLKIIIKVLFLVSSFLFVLKKKKVLKNIILDFCEL